MALAVRPVSAKARELANQYESIRATVEFVREDSVFLVLRDSLGRYIDGLWTGKHGPDWAVTL
jgi:hypothetical protein